MYIKILKKITKYAKKFYIYIQKYAFNYEKKK